MLKKALIQKLIRKENGISLIEVAIGLIVLGLIVTPIMQSYNIKVKKESKQVTRGSLKNAQNSINQYYASGNGAYPCPASLTLGESDVDFGKSGDCTLANIKLCTDQSWKSNEGICKTDDTANAVIIGGVPFATIKMNQENALDYWGNKIIYAVTFEQTDNATFTANSGQIRVNAVDDPLLVQSGFEDGIPEEKTNTIDFFLFSTGSSSGGGFTKDGIAITSCGNALNGYESENCNFDNRFFYDTNPNNNTASAFSEVVGVNFYDDITLGQESVPESTWFQHPDNASYTDDFVMTLSTAIGIGTTTPNETIDVVGDIRTNGGIETDSICDINNIECFDPELITGTRDEMECDADNTLYGNQAVMRLANNQVYCGSAIYSDAPNIPPPLQGMPIEGEAITVDTNVINDNTCDDGELISGIKLNGDVICVVP